MRPSHLCAALIAVWIGAPRGALGEPDTRPLGLDEAIALAGEHNPSLANADAAVDEAEADQELAAGAYDPALDISAIGHLDRPDLRSSIGYDPRADTASGTVAITKPFEHGGVIALRVTDAIAVLTTPAPAVAAGAPPQARTWSPRLEAELTEPLWGGRHAGAARRRQLAAQRQAAEHGRAAATRAVRRDVETAYWQLYFAQREAEIRAKVVAVGEEQLRLVRAEIASGGRPRLAEAEIEDELARRREDRLIADRALDERAIELARLIGLPATTRIRAVDRPPAPPPRGTDEPIAVAVGDNPEVLAARAEVEAAAAEIDHARDDGRWRIDARVTGATWASDLTARAAAGRAAGRGGWSIEAGLTIHIPLGTRASRGGVGGARARHARARIEEADAEARTAAELVAARDQLEITSQRRTVLARAVELATTNLDAEQRRWERGDTTSFEVLRRQASVGEAQIRAERARVDEAIARAAVGALTGDRR